MYYVYQVEEKNHVQINFSTSASQHKEILVEEQWGLAQWVEMLWIKEKKYHGVFSRPHHTIQG